MAVKPISTLRRSLAGKIAVSIGFVAVSFVAITALALVAIHRLGERFSDIMHEVNDELQPVISLQISMRKASGTVSDYVALRESEAQKKFHLISDQIELEFRRIRNLQYGLSGEKDAADTAYAAWRMARDTAVALVALRAPDLTPENMQQLARMESHVSRAIDFLGTLQELAHREIHGDFVAAKAASDRIFRLTVILIGLGLLCTVLVGVLLARSLLVRLFALTLAARRVSGGDFHHRVVVQSNDELCQLAQAFNAMALEIEKSHQVLRDLSAHDPLTGIYNRRAFDERLAAEMQRAIRGHRPLALLMLDLDHFKAVNDTFGHPAGDHVLQELVRLMRRNSRVSDCLARYGGEEFAVILPETDEESAFEYAERLRTAVASHGFVVGGQGTASLTISIGVAVNPESNSDPARLVGAADSALYAAKNMGRNCVQARRVAAAQACNRGADIRT